MPDWAAFAAATVALTAALLFFSRRSNRLLDRVRIVDGGEGSVDANDPTGENVSAGTNGSPGGNAPPPSDHGGGDRDGGPTEGPRIDPAAGSERRGGADPHAPVLTTELLLANVTVSQGIALTALVALAWWTDVPASAFGVGTGPGVAAVGIGVAAGAALYAGNEAAARLGDRVGATAPERLRRAMAPADARGWVLLFGLTLPVIAVFEEALFRGALIGAFAAGFALDPWALAVVSSVVFGLGHGAQGRLGVVVTGLLGVALAALFVRTGSLLVVIVAHYVVNSLEFLIHEGLGHDPIVAGVWSGPSR